MDPTTDPIRVLHVDDERDFVEMSATFLEREDDRMTVATATAVSEGLRRLEAEAFDCVVSDYDIPDRTGIEFLEAVRAEHPDLPFVLFTGKGSEEVASDAISAGVTEYLQKGAGTDQYAVLANRIRHAVARHRAERALEASRDRMAFALDATDSIVFEVDLDTREETRHGPFERLYGVAPEAVPTNRAFYETCVHPEDRDRVERRQRPEALPEGGGTVEVEFRTHPDNGDVRWISTQIYVDRDPNGDLRRTVGLDTDVTDRKTRERKHERLQERTRELMHTSTKAESARVAVETAADVLDAPLSGVHLLSEDGRTLEAVAVVDPVRETFDGPPAYERDATPDPVSELVWEAFESGEPTAVRDLGDHDGLAGATPARSGIIHPLAEYGVFIVSATEPDAFDATDETFVGILSTSLTSAFDRVERETALRANERELERQIDRLERFAGIVSHDLRNPLNVAQGQLELAREDCDSERLDVAADALARGEALIDDLLALAREGHRPGDVEPVDVADTAEAAWRSVSTADATLALETERRIRADPGRLTQLLENLIRNAVEHAGPDVAVTVGDLEGGFYVADDGPGIPAEKREGMLEPGHTTAADTTGLGLHIVREIAEAHGWEVGLTGSREGGLRVEIRGVETGAD